MEDKRRLEVDFAHVNSLLGALTGSYLNAKPFPHVSVSGLFDMELLRALELEFPSSDLMATSFKGNIEGGKYTESDFSRFGPLTQSFIAACNSGPFLQTISQLTGIEGLISDPYLAGGGQHQTERGGLLKIHSDFNTHPFLNLTRRINMLVYLNENWKPEWGGELELWDEQMRNAGVKIAPELGRVVIFNTTDTSFHGLPDPIRFPPGQFRRSIAFYYFTADQVLPEHRNTLWKERPNEDFLTSPAARVREATRHFGRGVKTIFKG